MRIGGNRACLVSRNFLTKWGTGDFCFNEGEGSPVNRMDARVYEQFAVGRVTSMVADHLDYHRCVSWPHPGDILKLIPSAQVPLEQLCTGRFFPSQTCGIRQTGGL